jgi:hypothetical protein
MEVTDQLHALSDLPLNTNWIGGHHTEDTNLFFSQEPNPGHTAHSLSLYQLHYPHYNCERLSKTSDVRCEVLTAWLRYHADWSHSHIPHAIQSVLLEA